MTLVGIFFFGGAAIFHGLAFFFPNISEPQPPWMHLTFFAVNTYFAIAFVFHSQRVAWPFLLLTLQQLWQHGGDIVRALHANPPHLDSQSVFALFGLGLVWLLLYARWKASNGQSVRV
jgi:hypothetical protein